jgi:DNA-binding transcriptional LysR family regulator
MIVRNFEYLIALGREQHFARAAGSCGVSQPTLSAGIKQLEEDMGVLIVKRGQRLQGFTPEGERVLAWAHQMLADCERLKKELQDLKEELSGPLRVGVLPAASPVLTHISVLFAQRHPKVELSLRTLPAEELEQAVHSGQLELALTFQRDQHMPGFEVFSLYRERYFLFTSAALATDGRRSVTWAEAAQLPLCLLSGSKPDLSGDVWRDKKIVFGDTPEIVAAHVNTGRWSTVLTQSLAALLNRNIGLRALPLSGAHNHEAVAFIAAKGHRLPGRVNAFLESAHDPEVVAAIRKRLATHKHLRVTAADTNPAALA